MSDSGPPPESKQLIATGDSVQADQATKWDFLKQQTVTLTLNFDDILKDGNQPSVNDCEFSVSGRMAFACKNGKTSQMASALEDLNVENSGSTTQSLQQQSLDPGKLEIVNFIKKSKTTLHEASDLLVECAEKLEEMRAALDDKEQVKKDVDSEIKETTRTVIDMLNKLSGNTGTVNSNDDNDDKPQGDDEDSDDSDKTFRGPEGGDTSEEPKHPPNYPPEDPSKNNVDSTGGFNPTKSADEQQSERMEPQLVETTTTDIDNPTDSSQGLLLPASTQDSENQEPVETDPKDSTAVETSVASPLVNESGDGGEHPLASELNKEEEDKKHRNESGEQKVENKIAGSSEDIKDAETLPQQEADLPQEHPALEDAPVSVTTSLVEGKEQGSGDSEPNPPASEVDKKEKDFEETPDVGSGSGSQPTSDLLQEHSASAESAIADDSGSAVAPVPDSVESQLTRNQKKKLRKQAKKEADRSKKEEDQTGDSQTEVLTPAATQNREKQEEPVGTVPKDITAVETSVASSLVPDLTKNSELDEEEENRKHSDKSEEQKVENKLAGSSEVIPPTGTLPQQEADLPQELPALKDAPVSETTPMVKNEEQESGDCEPNPPTSGVDRKEGDFEETPDAGSGLGSQPTSELPQEHSAPAESASADDSKSGVANVLDPVEKQLSRKEKKKLERKAKQEAERTSKKHSAPAEPVIEQIPKDNKAGNSGNDAVSESNVQHEQDSIEPKKAQNKGAQGDKNVKVEEDDSLISMDVMLLQYFVAMRDVRDKNIKPRRVQLSGLLGEISVFHQSDDFETYAAIHPNDLFTVVLGSEWIKERGVASDIGRQLVYFYKTPAKRYAIDIIACLHYHLGMSTNPDDKKVLYMKQLFAKFNEELFSWITSQWLKRAIRYGKHRLVEIEDKSSIYAWRDKPTDYLVNPNVDNRMNYYKTHTETFEDRLISSCYKYLTSQYQNLKKYHYILDFDLDYICAITPNPENSNEYKELLFFSNIFDFDRDLLKKLFYEKLPDNKDNKFPNQEAPAPPTDTGEESHENKDDKPTEDLQQQEFLTSVTLPILFSTMKYIREKNLKSEDFKFNQTLEQIYMFHTTREWKNNYKNNPQFTPDTVLTKLFGNFEELQNKTDKEHRFCRLVSANLRTQGLSTFAEELVAFMDHSYYKKTLENPGNDATTTKQSFLREFTFMVNEACENWINLQFETSLDDYFKYHDDRKKNLLNYSKDTEKYSWRPRPPSYQVSLLPRIDFHVGRARSTKCYVSLTIVTFYRYMIKLHKLNDYLNDALEFIFTRPEEKMKAAELKFFVSLFGLKKWSPWYSNNLLELVN